MTTPQAAAPPPQIVTKTEIPQELLDEVESLKKQNADLKSKMNSESSEISALTEENRKIQKEFSELSGKYVQLQEDHSASEALVMEVRWHITTWSFHVFEPKTTCLNLKPRVWNRVHVFKLKPRVFQVIEEKKKSQSSNQKVAEVIEKLKKEIESQKGDHDKYVAKIKKRESEVKWNHVGTKHVV